MKANRKTFESWVSVIEETVEAKAEALDNANDAEYPNDERIDKLEEEIYLLEEMQNLLEEYLAL